MRRIAVHAGRPLRAALAGALTLAASLAGGVPPASAGAPDLVVTAVSPVTPGVQASGSPVTFKATIQNRGNAATPAGVIHGVAFAINGSTVSWSDTSLASLAPGASRTVTANWGPAGSAAWVAGNGSFTLRARVDDVRRIGESSEANNDRTATLTATPVRAPTAVTVRGALTPEEFEAGLGKTVLVTWTVPPGQPVDTVYTVTEHPVSSDGGMGGEQFDQVRSTTPGTSATFAMETGANSSGHIHTIDATYSVAARSRNGGPSAPSAQTPACHWSSSHYAEVQYAFECGGVNVYEYENLVGERIDVGAPFDGVGWDKDNGFTDGTAYTRSFAGLAPELHTSRWGFTKYTVTGVPTDHPVTVTVTMVEPTFTAPGRRVFDLEVNGQVVATDVDIFAQVGLGKPYTLTFSVVAPDGIIELIPVKRVDNPIIATLEVDHY